MYSFEENNGLLKITWSKVECHAVTNFRTISIYKPGGDVISVQRDRCGENASVTAAFECSAVSGRYD